MTHYYDCSNLQRIPDLVKLAPQTAASFLTAVSQDNRPTRYDT
ncbi:hypothetical protein [Paenibacillus selenitireducens]|nr:hypothetical protein [Paenibacillus selenitireducens]